VTRRDGSSENLDEMALKKSEETGKGMKKWRCIYKAIGRRRRGGRE